MKQTPKFSVLSWTPAVLAMVLAALLFAATAPTALAQNDDWDWGDGDGDVREPGLDGDDNGDGDGDGDGDTGTTGDTGTPAPTGSTWEGTSDHQLAQLQGPWIDRAPVRSHAGAFLAFNWDLDQGVGQFTLDVYDETALPINDEMAFSLFVTWGVALAVGFAPAIIDNFQIIQPITVGAKFNFLKDVPDGLFATAFAEVGFLDDTVGGVFDPNNLPPGVVATGIFLGFGVQGTYFLGPHGFDGAFNLTFEFTFQTASANPFVFNSILEFVYLLSTEWVLRVGFDFHSQGTAANLFVEENFYLADNLDLFGRVHFFLHQAGVTFDLAFVIGIDLSYSLGD